eukprot:EG_transcript_7510
MGCASSCATVVPRAVAPPPRAAAAAVALRAESSLLSANPNRRDWLEQVERWVEQADRQGGRTGQPTVKPHAAATALFDLLEQEEEEHSPVSFRTLSDDEDLTGPTAACASPLPRRRPNALLTFRVRAPPRTPQGENVLTSHPLFASVARLPIVAHSPKPWAAEPRPLPRTHRVSPLLPPRPTRPPRGLPGGRKLPQLQSGI